MKNKGLYSSFYWIFSGNILEETDEWKECLGTVVKTRIRGTGPGFQICWSAVGHYLIALLALLALAELEAIPTMKTKKRSMDREREQGTPHDLQDLP